VPILALVAACAPDIQQDAVAPAAIVVQFDPGAAVPVVPIPNDLAKDAKTGKIVVPASPTDSPAQAEFNKSYLGTLDGFPFESTAQVGVSGPLKPETVNAQNVLAIDTTTGAPVAIAPIFANNAIVVPPPAGGWQRGKRYAIALVAGPNGLRGANNEEVLGSATWTLVSSRNPLVTCADLKTDCKPTVDIIPSTVTDPAARLADQTAKALQLEQLRRGYAPILDALAATGIDRASIPIVWTFTVVDAGEVTFDPANSVIPFPNDVVRTGPPSPTTGQATVTLPNPKTGQPLTTADCVGAEPNVLLVCGLNTLDGFSTLAPLVSENSDTLGAVTQATIDAASLSPKSVGLVRLASTAPSALKTDPKWTPCLGCTSSPDASGAPQTSPQQLQWKLDAPLDEKTTYMGFVTTDVKDDKGKNVIPNPVFALLRSTQPLLDPAGKATVSILTDAQAAQLEPLRAALKPAFDGLEAGGVPRTSLALGFPFTTQSESTILDQLHAYPGQPALAAIPDVPILLVDATAQYDAAMDAAGAPRTAVGNVYAGAFLTPVAVTGPSGTLAVTNPAPLPVPFVIALPKLAPASGAPVTIFGHGLTRSRNDFIAIANAIASTGQAVIATDVLFHGDRSSCTGSKASTAQASDDASCANPTATKCDEGPLVGLCVLRDDTLRAACTKDPTGDGVCAAQGQGRCATDGKCQGAGADLLRDATGRPAISGWNLFSLTNFFATRDNFRQQVIDLAKLVRVLKNGGTGNLAARIGALNAADKLDTSKINYVGQDLGGILGTLFNAVSPDTTNVVLNVPGGALPQIILSAPSFEAQRTALLRTLAAEGINPGTPAFDQFVRVAQWILDAADPANMAYRLTHPVDVGGVMAPNAARKVFIQFIEGDETTPNVASFAVVAGANRSFVPTPPSFGCVAPLACYEFTEAGDGFDAATAEPSSRHGFLLKPPVGSRGPALTAKAQTQVATFLATGSFQ
jgi:hypothetical protein